ncbi:exonuclease SbcC [Aspergillus parasiticus SU-1]|uniref:Exonuclease SbcC n=1 Tax=Aspergillus parasiticus (strain ATCC 56775 / NRRL 5862 / SRRC 143 / SU-1) TaxID=1403190 RepID=A0A0F0I1R8_ASPPU|nr:exonuclease SbcC [Aspergillus parasiticus SU-1]
MTPKDKSKDKSFWSSIKTLQAAAEDMINHSKSFKTHEELQHKNTELENQLKAAYSMVEDHKRQLEEERQKQQTLLNEKAHLSDFLEERVKGWMEKEKELLAQLQKTREDAETSRDAQLHDLSRKVRDQDEQLRRVRTELGERNTTIVGLQGRLAQSQQEVEELKRATQLEDFGPDLIQNIKELEVALRDMVQKYFYKDFPTDISQVIPTIQQVQWKACTPPNPFSMFPMPVVGQSKKLRASCVQSLISSRLSRDIFQSLCLEAPASRMPMSYFLDQCNQITSQEKALLRALLVKVFESDEQKQVGENIESVVFEVVDIVEPLLDSGCTGFEDELRHFLQNAADLWGKVQQSSKWVTTISDGHLSAEAGRSNTGKGTDLRGHPVLVLFPHFITPGEAAPLHKGSMLQVDSESIRQTPSKWLDVERAMPNEESAVILREVPRYNHSLSRSPRNDKSFTQHLNTRKRHDSQTRQSRASRGG